MPRLQYLPLIICLATSILSTKLLADSGDQTPQLQNQTSDIAAMPTRGMNMDEVIQHFGQPLQRSASVGKPPITRWKYEGLVVYFEHEYVIHTKAINNADK